MNATRLSLFFGIGIWLAISAGSTGLGAATMPASPGAGVSAAGPASYQKVAFSDGAEAGMLRRAYIILATGDHDYKGHRVRAMRQIEAAADLLGMNVKGDLKDRQPQSLSDAKLREARNLLQNVLGSSEVKDQKRVTKHISAAVSQIDVALSVR